MNLDYALPGEWSHLPIQERVADKLGDILYASDEILDMIRCGRADHAPNDTLVAIEKLVSGVYTQVNELMKKVVD
jgi:hypothetical protein